MIDFNKVFNHNFALLYNKACCSLQEADAEEVVADTFISYWQHREEIKYTFEDCRNWLVGVLHNKIKDRIKYINAKKRRAIFSHGWIDEDEALHTCENPNDDVTDYREELKTALSILGKQQRKILNLFMCGMTAREIAIELGISHITVMNQRVTAVKKLRDHFGSRTGKNNCYINKTTPSSLSFP